jgi:hypothetical protein
MKSILLPVALVLACSPPVRAAVFTTVSDGNWDDPAVWAGGAGPGNVFGDTVEIRHCLFYGDALRLSAGARMILADSAKLCGYHNLHVTDGAWLYIFGRLYFDTLYVTYGHLFVKNNAQAFIGRYIIISGIGATGYFAGPWIFQYFPYSCQCTFDTFIEDPSYSPPADSAEDPIAPEVYPNPFTDIVYFSPVDGLFEYVLRDERGRLVRRERIESDRTDLGELAPGMYIITLVMRSGETVSKRLVKIH